MKAETSPSATSVFYDAVYTLAGRIAKTLLALACSILIARVLGPHDRGLFALATAVYCGLPLAVFSGISFAASYFMLNARAGRGILKPALGTTLIFSIAGATAVAGMGLAAHDAWAILPAALLLPANAGLMLLLGYALGTKRIRWQTNYYILSTAATLAAMAITFAFFSRSASAAIAAYVLVSLIAGAASCAVVIRGTQHLPSVEIAFRRFFSFAVRVGASNLVMLLNYRADLYIVALLATPAVLGQYSVAVSAAEALLVVTQVSAIATSPHVGAMARNEAALVTAKCVRMTLVVSTLMCAVLFVAAPLVVNVLYGNAYLPLVPAFRILLVAVLILSVASPIANFFTLNRGRPEVALVSAAAAACLCAGISWMLVPRFGMAGAALGTVGGYLLGESTRMVFFLKESGTPIRAVLIPTSQDFRLYLSFAMALKHDSLRVLARFASAAAQPRH